MRIIRVASYVAVCIVALIIAVPLAIRAQTGDLLKAEQDLLGDLLGEKPAVEPPAEEPVEAPAEKPAVEPPAEEPVEAPAEKPAVEPPAEEPAEAPAEKPAVEPPAEEPVEAPAEKPAVEPPAEEPAEAPAEKPAVEPPPEEPVEAPAEKPAVEPPAEDDLEKLLGAEGEKPAATEKAGDLPVADTIGEQAVPAALPATAGEEEEQRQKIQILVQELQAMHDLDLGEKAYAERSYAEAIGHFTSSEKNLTARPQMADARRRANEGAMLSQYYLALEKVKANELKGTDAALDLAEKAYARNRKFKRAKELIDRIKLRIAEQEEIAKREGDRRRSAPDFVQREEQVDKWKRDAIEHMRANEYDKAREKLKMILAVDHNDTMALELWNRVSDKRLAFEKAERTAMVKERMADVIEAWNPRDYHLSIKQDAPAALGRREAITKTKKEELIEKMKRITIREIMFREAAMADVVKSLVDLSREGDTSESDVTKKGVSIILNLGVKEARPITFEARYVTLYDALKIITEIAELKYRVEGSIVMIVPKDYPEGNIVTRFYPVDPASIQNILRGGAGGGADADAGGGDGFLDIAPAAQADDPGASLKKAFMDMGVPFPAGGKISYNPTIGRLIVSNTEDNLTQFEIVLQQLQVVQPQVEIEARFVDISQDDLQELGFEWVLTDNWELLQQKGSRVPLAARPRVQMNANDQDGGFSKFMRFTTPGREASEKDIGFAGGGGEASGLLTFTSVLTNPELMAIVHAIEQKGRGDLLSAPRVTTQPGVEATVSVVTEYIYPSSYRVEAGTGAVQVDAQGRVVAQPALVVPDEFETREVGVILTVLPEVSPNNDIITLTLAPEVVTDPQWRDYGYKVAEGVTVPMLMPFFGRRHVSTTVRVEDGATVVMGGMIKEAYGQVDDRIPLLGDIPIVGRLFRSQHEKSSKRNLLIFVTARLVDPQGRIIKNTAARADAAPGGTVSASGPIAPSNP